MSVRKSLGLSLLLLSSLIASCDQSEPLYVGVTDASVASFDSVWIVEDGKRVYQLTDAGKVQENRKFGDSGIVNVYFLSPAVGWALSEENQLWKTEDGGAKWTKIGELPSRHYGLGRQILFASESVGWAIELLSVWNTTDGGATWNNVTPLDTNVAETFEPLSVYVSRDGRCFLGTANGLLFKTENNGRTWEKVVSPLRGDVKVLYFRDENGWVADNRDGGFYHTRDAGQTWDQLFKGESKNSIRVRSIEFSDDLTGWAVGSIKATEGVHETWRAVLLKSTDGGTAWVVNNTFDETDLFKISFPNTRQAVIIGQHAIYKSNDSGNTWSKSTDF